MKQFFNSLRVCTTISIVLFSMISCSSSLLAEEIKTSCFKVVIPSGMSAEWNKKDTILAAPVDQKLKTPFLQINYVASSDMTDRFEKESDKVKKIFQNIRSKIYEDHLIILGEREDNFEDREIYAYLAIIKGINIGVIMTYLSHDKQEGDKSQFNDLVNQIIESNKEISQSDK